MILCASIGRRHPSARLPAWHHRLTGDGSQRVYSGTLDIDIYAETPLFIGDPRSVSPDPRRPALSLKNGRGDYAIPGSSLKGLLRNVFDNWNGRQTLFDGVYERNQINYQREVAPKFQHCSETNDLCITCRTFGMLKDRSKSAFLGKVNVSDAVVKPETLHLYEPIYSIPLMQLKPHHASSTWMRVANILPGANSIFITAQSLIRPTV